MQNIETKRIRTLALLGHSGSGKTSLAEKLFERIGQNNDMIYVVSDNTGNSNGGSDDLNTRGRNIKNTKSGDVDIATSSSSSYNTYTRRTLSI